MSQGRLYMKASIYLLLALLAFVAKLLVPLLPLPISPEMRSCKHLLVVPVLFLYIARGEDLPSDAAYISVHEALRSNEDTFPDTLTITLRAGDGATDVQLNLHRAESMNMDAVKISEIDANGNTREWTPDTEQESSLYQDWENDAVISMKLDNSATKKDMIGTFVHKGHSYEIVPASEDEQNLQQRDLSNSPFKLHVIKRSVFSKPASVARGEALSDEGPVLRGAARASVKDQKRGDPANPPPIPAEQPPADPDEPDAVPQQSEGSVGRPAGSAGGPGGPAGRSSGSSKDGQKESLLKLLQTIEKERRSDEEDDQKRKKRSVFQGKPGVSINNREFNIELTFMVDDSAYDHFVAIFGSNKAESELINYYKHLFNGANMAYRKIQKSTDGVQITVWLKEILIFKRSTDTDKFFSSAENGDGSYNASTVGWNFGQWTKVTEGRKWHQSDHNILFTVRDLAYENLSIVGHSNRCRLCSASFSWSVVKDEGMFSWTTLAHELGHNAGAYHDGEMCGRSADKFLMSKEPLRLETQTLKNSFMFSACSINEMAACLSGTIDGAPKVCAYDSVCLSQVDVKKLKNQLPGQRYNLDKQCELAFGTGHSFDSDCYDDPGNPDICKYLTCSNGNSCQLGSPELRAFPGTKCGSSNNKWCLEGSCVKKKKNAYSKTTGRCSGQNSVQVTDCIEDKLSYCEDWVAANPYLLLTDGFNARNNCLSTAKKYGLYLKVNDPCVCEGLYDFPCIDQATNQQVCKTWNYFCDFQTDCKRVMDEKMREVQMTDEDTTFCKKQSLEIPYCRDYGGFLSYYMMSTDKSGVCIHPEDACDGHQDIFYGPDEDSDWCKALPQVACEPGFKSNPNNPSVCISA